MNHPIHSKYLHTYARYYDDGFFIWNGPEDSLTNFLSYINSIDKHIQTTSSYGKTTIYLDIQITLTEHNILLTRTHRKSTATDTYLDYRSSHPKHLKSNLPMSILFRSLIICNTQSAFKLESKQIYQRFKSSNYPSSVLNEAISKTMAKYNLPPEENQFLYAQSRRIAIKNIGKSTPILENNNSIYLPITHWPFIPYTKHFNNTSWTNKLNTCKIKNLHPTVSYKQPPNLLRLLTSALT